LAVEGATVVLTTRTDEKGQKALEQVKSYLSEKQIQNTSVYFLTLNLDDFESVQEYEGWASYSRTKLENIMFTRELQSRADAAGLDWFTTVSLHPGLVGTDIWRYSYMGTKTVKTNEKKSDSRSLQAMASNLFYSSALPTDVGANTQVWLAATGEDENTLVKGQYFDEHQQRQELANYAQDKDKAVKLWEMSEQFSGVTFKLE
jgi:NAD(P)-dependent dehydrogenase (short-subunit alcohol dehydrogenase family)